MRNSALGIDVARTAAVLLGLMVVDESSCVAGCGGRARWPSPRTCRPASLRWRRAAERTIFSVYCEGADEVEGGCGCGAHPASLPERASAAKPVTPLIFVRLRRLDS